MSKVTIIYWSGTGNTQQMAELIAEGAKTVGNEVELVAVENATKQIVESAKIIALGCPSMGAEVLEEVFMNPFIESLSDVDFSNKVVALFGSYDWGDGEWMRNWEDQMQGYGAKLLEQGLIVNLAPKGDDVAECKALGQRLAKAN